MPAAIRSDAPIDFKTFGDLLRYLRRRAGLSQTELAIAVGYSHGQISRLEHNHRIPDPTTIAARFLPALRLQDEPTLQVQLLTLATQRRTRQSDALVSPWPRNNLPRQLSSFIGREAELAQLEQLLKVRQLVTLTGPGGVGKTRLALKVAERLLADFEDGAYLLDFAALVEPELVTQALAPALGLPDEPGRPLLETVTAALRERRLLLVLDNCEHLLDACAQLAESLLHACARLTIVATSRQPLGLYGEAVYRVPALPFPDPDNLPPLEEIRNSQAVHLFVERARLVLPTYEAAAHNAVPLARICQRLDGMPLALELAAARMEVLTTATLAARLEDAMGALNGGVRTALPRHQTLRATLQWSYNLLSDQEQLLLQRLSVFAGGGTLEAAEVICADEALAAGAVLDHLAGLVNKSLVVAIRQEGVDTRFRLLEMVRQFAGAKLAAAGALQLVRARHQAFYLALAEASAAGLGTQDGPTWKKRVNAETDNLRAALDCAFSTNSADEVGPRLFVTVSGLGVFAWPEWGDWCRRAVAWCRGHPQISAPLQIRVLSVASYAVVVDDIPGAVALMEEAVALSRNLGPEERLPLFRALLTLAQTFVDSMEAVERAQAPLAECESLSGELGPECTPYDALVLLHTQAKLAYFQDRWPDAKRLGLEVIRLAEQLNQIDMTRVTCLQHVNVGRVCMVLGELNEARVHLREGLRLAEESGDLWSMAVAGRGVGEYELRHGQVGQAVEFMQIGLQIAVRMPDHNLIAQYLALAAGILVRNGRQEAAARLSGAAQALFVRQGRTPLERFTLDAFSPGWRDGLCGDVMQTAFEAGQATPVSEAVALALSAASA